MTRPFPSGPIVTLLISLGLLLLTGLITHPWSAQPASRYLLTVAAVDDHSLRLDPYEDLLGIDRAEHDGHTYTDKAPYQPLLAAVPFQLYRAVGGDSFPRPHPEEVVRTDGNVGLWWVTLWSCAVPAVLLALVLRRMVATDLPGVAVPVAIAMVACTTILPFASWLFGHVLAALFVTMAWRHLRDRDGTSTSVLVAGVWLGFGIGTEYTVAAIALVLLVEVTLRRRLAPIVALCGGTVIGVLPLMLYNWLVFRDPFEVAYQGHLPNFQGEGALGVYNLEPPRLQEVTKMLVGDRGLFVLTPVMLLAVVGAGWLARRPGPLRRDGVVGLAALAVMIVVSTGIDGYGGASPGPRYLIPVFGLLAVPMAWVWRRWPLLATGAALVGFLTMGLANATFPMVDTRENDALGLWIQAVGDGNLAVNIVTRSSNGAVLLGAAALGAAALVGAVVLDARRQAIQ